MVPPNDPLRVCPTRTDGRTALVAHKVTLGQCQERQRGQYHKCFACVFNNRAAALRGPSSSTMHSRPAASPPPIVEIATAPAEGTVELPAPAKVAG